MFFEKKIIYTFANVSLMIFLLLILLYSDKPPLMIYLFNNLILITISVLLISTYRQLKTYYLSKYIVCIICGIILLISLFPLTKILIDLSNGPSYKTCEVLDYYDFNSIEGKKEIDNKRKFIYKCEDNKILEQYYFLSKNGVFDKILYNKEFIKNVQAGDIHKLKLYEESNILVYAKSGNEILKNSLNYIHIVYILAIFVLYKCILCVKEDDYETIKYLISMKSKFGN